MTEELKPCPFCGGHNTTQEGHYRECLDCETFGPSEDRQSDRWNARPVEDALRSRIKELEEALQGLEPYLDAIVCYASTCGEHEPNRLVVNARQALNPGKEGKSK